MCRYCLPTLDPAYEEHKLKKKEQKTEEEDGQHSYISSMYM